MWKMRFETTNFSKHTWTTTIYKTKDLQQRGCTHFCKNLLVSFQKLQELKAICALWLLCQNFASNTKAPQCTHNLFSKYVSIFKTSSTALYCTTALSNVPNTVFVLWKYLNIIRIFQIKLRAQKCNSSKGPIEKSPIITDGQSEPGGSTLPNCVNVAKAF